jgi:hypothetical protein
LDPDLLFHFGYQTKENVVTMSYSQTSLSIVLNVNFLATQISIVIRLMVDVC